MIDLQAPEDMIKDEFLGSGALNFKENRGLK